MHSLGANSFGASVGNALGGDGSYVHGFPGDGTLPASAKWMFAVLIWRVR